MSYEYERLLTKVGTLYYLEDLPQNAIAERLGISRSKVCRLIANAKSKGIVQINIRSSYSHYNQLEQQLENTFGLREAVVVEDSDNPLTDIGRAGASYLQRVVKPNDIIGISWGSFLSSMVEQMAPLRVENLKVVQLVGGINPHTNLIQSGELALRFAMACGCSADLLYCPVKAANMDVKLGLLADPTIQRVIQLGKKTTVAVVGIGALHHKSQLFHSGFVSTENIPALRESGAVGDICMRFFDRNGNETDNHLAPLTMAISMKDLKKINNVICLASGREKVEALLGALRGKVISTIITDAKTAQLVLELHQQTKGLE